MKELPCDKCNGACCKAIYVQIDNPKTKKEFDDIRWYLLHPPVNILIEDKLWFVGVNAPCIMLGVDNKCKDYNGRPDICIKYGAEKDECEFDGMDGFVLKTVKEYEDYMYLKHHDIPLLNYNKNDKVANTSGIGLTDEFLYWCYEYYPEDFKKIKDHFPLVESVIYRRQ